MRFTREECDDPYDDSIMGYMHILRNNNDKFVILPGLEVTGKWPAVATDLVVALCTEIPEETAGWSRLLTAPGQKCIPYGSVADAIQWDAHPLYTKVMRMCGRLTAMGRETCGVSMNAKSNCSYPSFSSSDIRIKVLGGEQNYDRCEEILGYIHHRDVAALHELPIPMTFGGAHKYRGQCDKYEYLIIKNGRIVGFKTKDRRSVDWKGREVTQDKKLRNPVFRNYPYLSAERVREVYPCEHSSNAFGQNWSAQCLKGQLNAAKGDIFHTTTPESIISELRLGPRWNIETKDESQNDMHLLAAHYRTLLDGYVDGGLTEEAATVQELLYRGPTVCFKDYPPVDNYMMTYPPRLIFDMYKQVDYGCKSGHNSVTVATQDDVCTKDFCGLVLGGLIDCTWLNLFNYRRNRLPILRCKTKGDNTIFNWLHEYMMDAYLKGRVELGMPVDPDPPAERVFLGNRVSVMAGSLTMYPQLDNYLKNILSPERPITSKLRENWQLGLYLREHEHYSKNPYAREVLQIADNVLARHGVTTITQLLRDFTFDTPPNLELTNAADVAFILNPDAIHYKLDVERLSRKLYEEYFIAFPPERVERFDATITNHAPKYTAEEIEQFCVEQDRKE